jgi:hypothetical protein
VTVVLAFRANRAVLVAAVLVALAMALGAQRKLS